MLTSTEKWLEPELMDVVRLFPSAEELPLSHKMEYLPSPEALTHSPAPACGGGVGEGELVRNTVVFNGKEHVFEEHFQAATKTEQKSLLKRYAKLALYEVLSAHYQKNLPWGSLTGIRPTRLAYGELEKGGDFRALFRKLKVSQENIELVARVLEGQKGVYEHREGNVDLYVSLPFCPSKCNYCSFITAPIDKTRQFVPAYLAALERELEGAKPLIKNLRSVYVGGGTPFVLEPCDLERVLRLLAPLVGKAEFTVEAGRPDVFTTEKLDLCQRYGVTRICINAQSFSDKTLSAIGRKHTCAQLYEAFEMAKPYPFTVNCDLIAGLTGESVAEFRSSVEQAIALSPENITVHTLCLKKGAKLKEEHLSGTPARSKGSHESSPAPACGEASVKSPAPAYGRASVNLPAPAYGRASVNSPAPACGRASVNSPAPACGEASVNSPAPAYGRTSVNSPAPAYGRTSVNLPAPVCGEASVNLPAPACGRASVNLPAPACGGGVGEGVTSFSPSVGGRGGSPALTLLPEENLSEMIAFSREVLTKAGYEPYYLYRQKYMAGAHENVGWTKKGYASVYNIDVMEESADNLAIGSNAITKRVILSEGRIERLGSPKDIPTYLEKVEKLIEDKKRLFS